jgi:putative DNA methylase
MLGICVSKLAQANNTLVRWVIDPRNGSAKAVQSFDRHAVPMVWDFTETNPFGGSVGDWTGPVVTTALRALEIVEPHGPPVQTYQLDARALATVINRNAVIATDPPYYGNIGYADLSDFFYIWLRRALRQTHPSLFATLLTPKDSELIATPYRHKGGSTAAAEYFRQGFQEVFASLKHVSRPDTPMTVVYSFKQQEERRGGRTSSGWDVMLEGLLTAGLGIVGTWPLRTARAARMIGVGTNALASAILIVSRPRSSAAPLATRREFLASLKNELPSALKNLQRGNIAPVDLAQAAIGPGMAVFSRYSKVIEADGSSMTVRAALALINQMLDEILAEQEGEFDPDTRWSVSWFEQYGTSEGPYGAAETLSKAKNTALEGLQEAGILVAKAGKVRLLSRSELDGDWDPTTARRLTVWEVTHQLIRALERGGETSAAALLRKVGALGETARDLAYRLYGVCERKKWSQEGLAYNSLVIAWPEIARLARAAPRETQSALQL